MERMEKTICGINNTFLIALCSRRVDLSSNVSFCFFFQMSLIEISDNEKLYVLHGVQDDVRIDGRHRRQVRPLKFETELVTHANGSANLRLANTDILVGVKAELDLDEEQVDKARLEFFVDCSANATPEFEGRGGEALATDLSKTLAKAYSDPKVFDYASLRGDGYSWILYIDILILEVGGNLFDAVSMAVKAALHATIIPKVRVSTIDGGQPELELSDDPLDGNRLDVTQCPILVTMCRIGNYCVVDPTPEEEACSIASLVLGITPDGSVTASKKIGPGSFNLDALQRAIQDGQEVGKEVQKALMDKIVQEERMGIGRKKIGFLK